GEQPLPNGIGVIVSSSLIGGTDPGAGNLISGNTSAGISGGYGNTVQGNLIGTDVTGHVALGNSIGIYDFNNSTIIGGTTVSARNVISGNTFDISICDGTLIEGNYIGTDITGEVVLPTSG